jgi:hypothetical protein
VEEGEIGEEGDAAAEETAEGSGENLAGVKADLRDLVKARTCFIGRSLMTQADLDALRLEGCFEPGICRLPGKETTPKPRKMRVWCSEIFSLRGFICQSRRNLLTSWQPTDSSADT